MPVNISDVEKKCETLVKLVEQDILTLDEARKELGYPPLADEMGRFTRSMYVSMVEHLEHDEDDFLNVNSTLN